MICERFMFLTSNLFAQIAQLVEQRTENPRVTGSIPVLGMKKENPYGYLFIVIVRVFLLSESFLRI